MYAVSSHTCHVPITYFEMRRLIIVTFPARRSFISIFFSTWTNRQRGGCHRCCIFLVQSGIYASNLSFLLPNHSSFNLYVPSFLHYYQGYKSRQIFPSFLHRFPALIPCLWITLKMWNWKFRPMLYSFYTFRHRMPWAWRLLWMPGKPRLQQAGWGNM